MSQPIAETGAKNNIFARAMSVAISRYFNIFIIVMVIAVFVGAFFFLIKPRYNKIAQDFRERNRLLLDERSQLEINKARLSSYQKAFSQVDSAQTARLDKFLPRTLDRDAMFLQMESIIADRGYTLNKIALSEDAPAAADRGRNAPVAPAPVLASPAGVGVLQIDLDISDIDYSGLKNLLGIFEQSLRLYDIVQLDFDNSKGSAAFKVQAYYML